MTSDKHMEAAREVASEIRFGLADIAFAEAARLWSIEPVIEKMNEMVAAALAQAEHEGMKRAAEIAEHLNGWGSGDGTAEHIAKAILAEAGEG